jgi:hypothetical protein
MILGFVIRASLGGFGKKNCCKSALIGKAVFINTLVSGYVS